MFVEMGAPLVLLIVFLTNVSINVQIASSLASLVRTWRPALVSELTCERLFVTAIGLNGAVLVHFWALFLWDPHNLVPPQYRHLVTLQMCNLQHTLPAVFLALDAAIWSHHHRIVMPLVREIALPVAVSVAWFVLACIGKATFGMWVYPFMETLRLVDWAFLVVAYVATTLGVSVVSRFLRSPNSHAMTPSPSSTKTKEGR
jgi:hypothetical protein